MNQQNAAATEEHLATRSELVAGWKDAWREVYHLGQPATAAFLVRCVRRVQPLLILPPSPLRLAQTAALEGALQVAEGAIAGKELSLLVQAEGGCAWALEVSNDNPLALLARLAMRSVVRQVQPDYLKDAEAAGCSENAQVEGCLESLLKEHPDELLKEALIHVAVIAHKVIASDDNLYLLRKTLINKHGIDPSDAAIILVD